MGRENFNNFNNNEELPEAIKNNMTKESQINKQEKIEEGNTGTQLEFNFIKEQQEKLEQEQKEIEKEIKI